ncbi:glycosyltransferase family 2 protein [Flavobacteriaceae bacterium S0825]|uniref:glycosyltransferase family 2 protein n=1 Tax=Gaetbulibacter sp. S0825 TaxID=2720084 RepID=UPI0014312784|nr:glycosyltransferase family 2 protein [Gaetbulibacter sp. S0825]MCK0108980.1 glycosyltransferase family 2 protein [Flavobacteriaceae bacterium S0825]NIX64615.1 glycosyltransferase [Gaetbulibacter sp. S0825]
MGKPSISVIISTYNSEAWLEKVLWSYEAQTFKDFEIVIADDGSKQPTFDLIEKMKGLVHYDIIHVWHEDNGFQKTIILNKAILASSANYLVFTDGDCIARKDFLETHVKYRKANHFLSGGYFKLPMTISNLIKNEDILSQKCFSLKWLKQHGIKSSFKNNKLNSGPLKAKFLNFITPTNASWNGHNSSGWKEDIVVVNGFDERMQYGGEDRELGERLINYSVKPIRIRYSAICLHLDHARGYVNPEMIEKNKKIRATTKKEKVTRTLFGIEKI